MPDSSIKHTPGPWTAFFSVRNQRTGAGDWCFTGGPDRRSLLKNGRRSEADARLIAAAPDLLEIAKAVIALQSLPINSEERIVAGGKISAMSKLAVAKAEAR